MNREIQNIIEEISSAFQKLEELLRENNIENVNIRFPRGVIRRADYFRNRLSFIDDQTLKTNLAYHLMLSDVYRWILNRFDIALTAKEMLIKEGISLIGNILEAIIVYTARKFDKSEKIGFSRGCTILMENGIITHDQKKALKLVWGMRCKQHILNLPNTEYGKYTLQHYNEAIQIWHDLEKALWEAKKKGLI